MKCHEHGELCAYDDDDPARCPWCHASWTLIETRGNHSCEDPNQWHSLTRWDRIADAAWMRVRASQRDDQRTDAPSLDVTPWPGGRRPLSSSQTPAEGVRI